MCRWLYGCVLCYWVIVSMLFSWIWFFFLWLFSSIFETINRNALKMSHSPNTKKKREKKCWRFQYFFFFLRNLTKIKRNKNNIDRNVSEKPHTSSIPIQLPSFRCHHNILGSYIIQNVGIHFSQNYFFQKDKNHRCSFCACVYVCVCKLRPKNFRFPLNLRSKAANEMKNLIHLALF